jgi:hypothetical protein
MILIFLGSWRSTVIVATSIPLSILTSIIALGLLGHTINIMTLGGLDPAHRAGAGLQHHRRGRPRARGAGTNLIVTPPDGLQASMTVRPVPGPKPKS